MNMSKRNKVALTVGIGGFAMLMVLLSILSANTNAVNVVTDITPRHQLASQQVLVLESLKGLPPWEIEVILKEQWPTLATDLITRLRLSGRIKPEEKIEKTEFLYGSGEAVGEDQDANLHEGVFKEELLVRFIITGRGEPMLVAVKCTNGLFQVVGELAPVYEDNARFTVERGKSLVDYVSYETAIFLAETFGLPIHQGKGRRRHQITPEEARGVDTDKFLVSVLVYSGDEFDLQNMTYNRKSAE